MKQSTKEWIAIAWLAALTIVVLIAIAPKSPAPSISPSATAQTSSHCQVLWTERIPNPWPVSQNPPMSLLKCTDLPAYASGGDPHLTGTTTEYCFVIYGGYDEAMSCYPGA